MMRHNFITDSKGQELQSVSANVLTHEIFDYVKRKSFYVVIFYVISFYDMSVIATSFFVLLDH